jgi:hypothetical protein
MLEFFPFSRQSIPVKIKQMDTNREIKYILARKKIVDKIFNLKSNIL